MSQSSLDLKQLALDRTKTSGKPRRRWILRYALPGVILLAFLGLLGAAAEQSLLPAKSVTVVPIVVKRAAVQPEGTPLFQAAGWIEPRPTAIRVAALTAGVVEELLVVEGQQVKQHETLASLISIDAELAVEQAKASLEIRRGELARAVAERDAAIVRLEHPVHLRVLLADAEGALAESKKELAQLPFLIEAAEAKSAYSGENVEGKRSAQAAVAGRVLRQAESEFAEARAALSELRQRKPNLERQVKALEDKVSALQTQLELLVEERRQLEEAEAKISSAKALEKEAEINLRQAQLNLERTVVRAPINGRILRLIASPGRRVMGLESRAGHDSSTVVEMYDPDRLQVRADVRLENVPMVKPGQSVIIETASSENAIKGRVLQTTSTANVQKNTLEVKVALIDPPASVRPEMLVTATFLAPKTQAISDEGRKSESIFAPQRLVDNEEQGSYVWIVGPENRAERRSVTLGQPGENGLVEVTDGLRPTDKLIASNTAGLTSGTAVKITGEADVANRPE